VNVFFGRVAYTHGMGLDRPLSVVRFDYADSVVNRPFVRWAPFSLVPHWNLRGEADNGSFSDGALTKCATAGGFTRCVQVRWPFGWTATAQQAFTRDLWHGSLLEDKRDGSGLLFRRNRYMDPATGRFTQEDPIGLAGGLNLYGFAAGDPVNFSDPFGLCPPAWLCQVAAAAAEWGSRHPAGAAAITEFVGNVQRGASVWTGGSCSGPGCRTGAYLGMVGFFLPKVGVGGRGLSDDALVCRGGLCTADRFAHGSGVTLDEAGRLQGVSVESANGASLEALTASIPNKQVGVTTVGQIRAAGGQVVPSPGRSTYHATMSGITPQQAERLFTPTVPNPNRP
jgi:RHS repeat-associated protein